MALVQSNSDMDCQRCITGQETTHAFLLGNVVSQSCGLGKDIGSPSQILPHIAHDKYVLRHFLNGLAKHVQWFIV